MQMSHFHVMLLMLINADNTPTSSPSLTAPLLLLVVDQFSSVSFRHGWLALRQTFCINFLPLFLYPTCLPPSTRPADAAVRCEQLDLLLQWGTEFRQSSSQPPAGEKVLEDLVAFDVILGDLNFDNCSSGTPTSGLHQ